MKHAYVFIHFRCLGPSVGDLIFSWGAFAPCGLPLGSLGPPCGHSGFPVAPVGSLWDPWAPLVVTLVSQWPPVHVGSLWGPCPCEGLGELQEAPEELWESLEELWEALGELWERLGELGQLQGIQYITKLPISRPSGRYVYIFSLTSLR